jgi:CheY-specific phosphatase CheX
MAHVHGAKIATGTAETAKKMSSSMMEGMGQMGLAVKQPMAHGVSKSIAAGSAAAAGKSTLKKVLTHPVTLIGLGFVLGYLVYKYRKDIIAGSEE